MRAAARHPPTPITAQFEFDAFKSLPCGCVAAMYRTLDPGFCVISLEAKGSYCTLSDHIVGRVAAVPANAGSEISDEESERGRFGEV